MLDSMDLRIGRNDFDDEDHSEFDSVTLRNTVTGDEIEIQIAGLADMVIDEIQEMEFTNEEFTIVLTYEDAVSMLESHKENWEESVDVYSE